MFTQLPKDPKDSKESHNAICTSQYFPYSCGHALYFFRCSLGRQLQKLIGASALSAFQTTSKQAANPSNLRPTITLLLRNLVWNLLLLFCAVCHDLVEADAKVSSGTNERLRTSFCNTVSLNEAKVIYHLSCCPSVVAIKLPPVPCGVGVST